jgi:polysaccharide deacetylase family protein (PEP-CTERM system associated)
MPPRIGWAVGHVLDLLDEYSAKATFFVVGWVAEKHPLVIREIVARGHDVGCHSYWHQLLFSMTPSQFRDDTRRARTAIEQVIGRAVNGYRAPFFSITPKTAWAIDVLSDEGFLYDSSIFPVYHDVYGWPGAERHEHILQTRSSPLWELPPATFRVFRKLVLPVGGGGYLRMLPFAYTKFGLCRASEEGRFLLYCHPWEFDVEQPRSPSRIASRLRHNTGLRTMERKFRALLLAYRFTNIETAVREGQLAATAGEV